LLQIGDSVQSGLEESFGPLGVANIRTFVDPQSPAHVALMTDDTLVILVGEKAITS
jgi:hypothetical protein